MGNNHLPTDYQNFIAVSRYARYIESEKRRETWSETVARYMDNVIEPVIDSTKSDENFDLAYEIEQAILGLDIMPSVRMMMTAGPALERDNICGYNCSYLVVDDPKAFDDTALEAEKYDERSIQIASEMFYVFRNLANKKL